MTEIRYIVTRVEDCARCDGTGTILHPDWDAFWTQFPPDKGPPSILAERKFWESRGVSWSAKLPSEEMECPNCDGLGELRTEVSLQEALSSGALQ